MLPLPLRRPPLDSARCRWCTIAPPTRAVSPRLQVVYDPTKISFVDILRWFWEAHDPTQGMGQGNDRGTQYRSGFYYLDEEQKALIESSKVAVVSRRHVLRRKESGQSTGAAAAD